VSSSADCMRRVDVVQTAIVVCHDTGVKCGLRGLRRIKDGSYLDAGVGVDGHVLTATLLLQRLIMLCRS
jgi:hypothetical protein